MAFSQYSAAETADGTATPRSIPFFLFCRYDDIFCDTHHIKKPRKKTEALFYSANKTAGSVTDVGKQRKLTRTLDSNGKIFLFKSHDDILLIELKKRFQNGRSSSSTTDEKSSAVEFE